MDTPPLVSDHLDGESVRARVDLGGDDAVFVTPSRTLVYRGEGLLSDESVGSFPHDVERLSLSSGRRKTTFEFEYVDGEGTFSVGSDRVDAVLRPVLTGVLQAAGVLDDDETVRTVHRFKELTLAVADGRVVKHVGNALWDPDFESYPFAGVTDLDLEEGSVSDQLVMAVDGRPQRVKIPSEEAPAVYRGIEEAVLEYHGVDAVADLREDEADAAAADVTDSLGDDNIDPLVDRGEPAPESDAATADGAAVEGGATAATADRSATDGDAGAATAADDRPADGAESTADDGADGADEWVSGADLQRGEEILARLDDLEEAVDRQSELIEAQRETIDRLVEELQRGR